MKALLGDLEALLLRLLLLEAHGVGDQMIQENMKFVEDFVRDELRRRSLRRLYCDLRNRLRHYCSAIERSALQARLDMSVPLPHPPPAAPPLSSTPPTFMFPPPPPKAPPRRTLWLYLPVTPIREGSADLELSTHLRRSTRRVGQPRTHFTLYTFRVGDAISIRSPFPTSHAPTS
ncbi:hypothetical protein PENSPDRAFT_667517 [Peniophora sp. CONT]|nr:hypothetical protein PENSPDRAFT_667517 [Peniophora sp. CONT]